MRAGGDASGSPNAGGMGENEKVDWRSFGQRFGIEVDVGGGDGTSAGNEGSLTLELAPVEWAARTGSIDRDRDVASGGFGEVDRYLGLGRQERRVVLGLVAEQSAAIRNNLEQLGIVAGGGSQQVGPHFAQPLIVVPGSDVCDAAPRSLRELERLTEDLHAKINARMEAISSTGPRARLAAGGAGAILPERDIRTREQWGRFLREQGELYLSARRSIGNLVTRCGAQAPR